MASETGAHAFISYVREDADDVDRIEQLLKAADIPVWRDTEHLWPGEDWRLKIRQAITEDALVFIACFSDQSSAKAKSYQREELILAVEEYRLRNPEVPWLIPVRLSDVRLPPEHSLGAGRGLDALQRVDLFGARREVEAARLVAAVLRVLGGSAPPSDAGVVVGGVSPETKVKQWLLDPAKQIELDEYVTKAAEGTAATLRDAEMFPTSASELRGGLDGVRYLAGQVTRYSTVVEPLAKVLIAGSAWGQPQHDALWTRAVQRVASFKPDGGGQEVLLAMQRWPLVPLIYASAVASTHRNNFGPLRAVTVDAQMRSYQQEVPVISMSHIGVPIQDELVPDLLARELAGEQIDDARLTAIKNRSEGRRHTPTSDYLHRSLRPLFSELIPDGEDYDSTFDRAEVLLGAIAADVETQQDARNVYAYGPWFGRFTWRDRYSQNPIEKRVLEELRLAGSTWPPLIGGFFGGRQDRGEAAFEKFIEGAAEARRRRW